MVASQNNLYFAGVPDLVPEEKGTTQLHVDMAVGDVPGKFLVLGARGLVELLEMIVYSWRLGEDLSFSIGESQLVFSPGGEHVEISATLVRPRRGD